MVFKITQRQFVSLLQQMIPSTVNLHRLLCFLSRCPPDDKRPSGQAAAQHAAFPPASPHVGFVYFGEANLQNFMALVYL